MEVCSVHLSGRTDGKIIEGGLEIMNIMTLNECTDYDMEYGYLVCENDEISVDEIQDKINEIKNKFYDDGYEDWDIEEVIENMPNEWKVSYFDTECNHVTI